MLLVVAIATHKTQHKTLFSISTWRINEYCTQLAHHFSLFIWYCGITCIFFYIWFLCHPSLAFNTSSFSIFLLFFLVCIPSCKVHNIPSLCSILSFLWLLVLFNFQLFVVVTQCFVFLMALPYDFHLVELNYLCEIYAFVFHSILRFDVSIFVLA